MHKRCGSPRLVVAAGAGLLAVALGAAGVGEDRYVRQDRLDVTDSDSVLGTIVDALPKNTKVRVLENNEGWMKIQSPSGKQGYAPADALSDKADANAPVAVAEASADSPSGVKLDLAGRGLQPEAEAYSRSKNYDKTALNRLIALNERSSELATQWKGFCKEGKVGDAR